MSKIIERIKSMFEEKEEIEDTNIENIAENIVNGNGSQSKSEIEAILSEGVAPKLGIMKRPHTGLRNPEAEEKAVNLNGQRVTFILENEELNDRDERE